MNQRITRWGVAVVLAGTSVAPVLFAEDAQKTLPTLLIKGEIVSVDANDPTATLLKVKDRYGFETPIYVTPQAKTVQGDQPLAVSNLTSGTPVEVEYNFDINTAKRHAVNVVVGGPTTPSTPPPVEAPAAAVTTPAEVTAPAVVAPPSPEPASGEPPVPSTGQEHPGQEHPGETTQ